MRLGKHGAGEERICSKAGDEKGKSPCVSRVEPHTGQVLGGWLESWAEDGSAMVPTWTSS